MASSEVPATQAARAVDLTGTIGINLHLLGGQHNAWDELSTSQIISDLRYLGVTTVRNDVYDLADITPRLAGRYADLAAAGFTVDLCVGSSHSDLAAITASLDDFARRLPGAIRFVEGPNEINFFPFTYGGSSGQPAAIAFQADLMRFVHGDAALAGVQVLDFTGGGRLLDGNTVSEPIAGIADLATLHPYPANGDPPDWYLSTHYALQYGTAITAPFVVSETGYNSDPLAGYGVSEAVQARYTLDMLLDAAKAGSSLTAIYELFDLYADTGYSTYDDHWGLFYADGTPKPAATAVHNLHELLADTGPLADSFPTGSLHYSLGNLPDAGRSWLLQKSNGSFNLVVWSEPSLWNQSTRTAIQPQASTVTVDLGQLFPSVQVFDPLRSDQPIQSLTNVSRLSITLTDHPIVIETGLVAAGTITPITVAPPTVTLSQAITPQHASAGALPVFRFFDRTDGSHLFTASAAERDAIAATRPDLQLETTSMNAYADASQRTDAAPIFRFFDLARGTHFYTASTMERDMLLHTRSDLKSEGVAFYEATAPAADNTPVWRFFDTSSGTHLYTSSASEAAGLVAMRADLRPEGVAFYAPL